MEWRPKGGWRSQVRLALPSSARPTPAETLIYYLSHSKLKGITAERAERTDGRTRTGRTDARREGSRGYRDARSHPPPSSSRGQSVSQCESQCVCVGQEVSSGGFATGGRAERENCCTHPSIHPEGANRGRCLGGPSPWEFYNWPHNTVCDKAFLARSPPTTGVSEADNEEHQAEINNNIMK